MAAIAEMSPEAQERLKDFLEKRAAKVLRQSRAGGADGGFNDHPPTWRVHCAN
jgi:hypothetical protein